MTKIYRQPYDVKMFKAKAEFDEFGPAKSGVLICRRCFCFYYQKSWHHNPPNVDFDKRLEETKVGLALCPACRQAMEHVYEGEILVKDIPEKFQGEVANLVAAYGDRAFQKDCQHRLQIVSKNGSSIRITTTENQLAQRLAKKMKDAFKKLALKISHSRESNDVERVIVAFVTEM